MLGNGQKVREGGVFWRKPTEIFAVEGTGGGDKKICAEGAKNWERELRKNFDFQKCTIPLVDFLIIPLLSIFQLKRNFCRAYSLKKDRRTKCQISRKYFCYYYIYNLIFS